MVFKPQATFHDTEKSISESHPASRRNLIPWFVVGGLGVIAIIAWLLTSSGKPEPHDPSLIAHLAQQTQTFVDVMVMPSSTPTLLHTHTPTMESNIAEVDTTELNQAIVEAPVEEIETVDALPLDILGDTSTPTSTIMPSLTATKKPSQTPSYTIINVNDPTQFIREYYAAIIREEFEYTFSLLTGNFKSKYHDADKDGVYEFSPYVDWWDNFYKIELLRTDIQQQSNNQARVLILGRFYYKDGRVVDDQRIFHLVSDGYGGWKIDNVGG